MRLRRLEFRPILARPADERYAARIWLREIRAPGIRRPALDTGHSLVRRGSGRCELRDDRTGDCERLPYRRLTQARRHLDALADPALRDGRLRALRRAT